MKRTFSMLLVGLILMNTSHLKAQCTAGYTQASLNWDLLDYFVYSGNYTSSQGYLASNAAARTQHFAFGTQRLTIAHSFADAAILGENTSHTGETGSFGTGADINFNTNGAISFTFENEVRNFQVSVYDLDNSQSLNVTATNAGSVAQNVTLTKANGGALHVITGSGTTSATATSLLVGNRGTSENTGTINITVSGPVRTITLTFGGTSGDFWISDIQACSIGSFPTNYYSVARPFNGQPAYLLHAFDKKVHMVDPVTGNTKFIFEDASGPGNINSMAYDPYNHILYYVYSLTSSGNSRKLMKYDFDTETITELLSDINTIGIPTVSDNGLESGSAAFYNGALYLGVETSNSSRTSGREAVIWKIDFNGSNLPYRASQLFAVPIDGNLNGDNCLLHDWADFIINDGILYNFDAAENDRSSVGSSDRNQSDIYHVNIQTGNLLNQYSKPGASASPTWYPGQPGVTWDGTVYTVYSNGSNPVTAQGMPRANPYIAPYNAGNIGAKVNIVSTPMYTPTYPSLGDAAEAFRPKVDFGDAPASYDPVPFSQAVHEYNPLIRLGAGFDREWVTRGQSALANLDNFDDALPYVTTLYPSLSVYLTEATVFNNTGLPARVGAWLDFNADGQFQAAEGIIVNVPSSPAPQNIFLYFPNGTNTLPVGSYTYLRIRITTGAMTTANPTGYFADGEVEDYRVPVNMFPLSTQYMNFDVKKDRNRVAIKWNTTDEVAGSVYEIERSEDRYTWTRIYNKQVAMDASNVDNVYIDSMPLKGSSYYRLKTIFPDNKAKLSQDKQVNFPLSGGIQLSPNPTSGNFRLAVSSEQSSATVIRVIDMAGREVESMDVMLNEGVNNINFDLGSKLLNGVYTIQIKINQKIYTEKLVIRK